MKDNILLLCSGYLDSTSANGVCARNLAEEYIRQGHKVWVIAVVDKESEGPVVVNEVCIYGVPHAFIARSVNFAVNHTSLVGIIIRVLNALLAIGCYPKAAVKSRVKRVYKLASTLIVENNINVVIGTSFPYDSIEVSELLKKHFRNNIRVATYHFDLLFYPNNTNKLVYQYKRYRFIKAFNNECSIVDRVFLPETCDEVIEKKNVMKIGFPVYCSNIDSAESGIVLDSSSINITYVGSIDRVNRNPEIILRYFDRIINRYGLKIKIHIWGSISGDDIVSLLEDFSFVKYHGKLDNRYIQDVFKKSDFLLNISNKTLYKLLPSKIFQYFYSKKPIINFVQNRKDVSLTFFNKYKNSVNIYSDELASAETKLLEFINSSHSVIKDDTVKFERYRPSFICKFLLDC